MAATRPFSLAAGVVSRDFFGGRGGGGGGNTAVGQRPKLADQERARSSPCRMRARQSVIVSAASELMEQIRGMVTQLDANPAKKQKVYMYSLENADAQQVQQVLQEMFENTTTREQQRNSQNQNNVLQNRANQSSNQHDHHGLDGYQTRAAHRQRARRLLIRHYTTRNL